ncbi:DUF998 domain-containing protein [Nonomuraea sp. NPDC005692]|uniref:DUF998 domain-containing protein n=1 Tax=Nonomuraea sp. NPDC005692 TaxID=3157168 RepID=UPI0033E2BD27
MTATAADVPVHGTARTSRRLLLAGALAGPIFFASATTQMLTRAGFDITRHPISQLSTGDLGWIQILTFVLAGTGALALAVGVRRTLTEGIGRRALPILVGVFGAGLVAAGIFTMDPEQGFPAGTPEGPVARMSWHGIAHSAAAAVAFATLGDDAEVTGLLALMLLTESRRAARTDGGDLVPLDEQDRTRWDHDLIDEGIALIDGVWNRDRTGPYQLQAAIAAVHSAASAPDRTDWVQIAVLYMWLERLTPTAPVQLSRVVAVAHAYGPARGLALLDDLDRRHHLDRHPLTRQREHAVRAHLLQMTGDTTRAAALYRRAADLTANQVEQRYLLGKAGDLS